MMLQSNKPYFNHKLTQYGGIEPFFYSNINFEWCKKLQSNYETIKNEFINVYTNNSENKKATEKFSLDKQNGWTQAELLIYGLWKEKNIKLFPQTYELIKNIKNISTCYFSILTPNTQIHPHIGDTDAYYRFHLGLIIPKGLPECGIQVGSEKRDWKENEFTIFNDVYKHTAWNNTNEIRVVLIIDILRDFEDITKKEVEANVLTAIAYSRINKHLYWLFEFTPKTLTRLIIFILKQVFLLKLR